MILEHNIATQVVRYASYTDRISAPGIRNGYGAVSFDLNIRARRVHLFWTWDLDPDPAPAD